MGWCYQPRLKGMSTLGISGHVDTIPLVSAPKLNWDWSSVPKALSLLVIICFRTSIYEVYLYCMGRFKILQACLVRRTILVKFSGSLSRSINGIERRLITKLITRKTNPLNLINPSLDMGYCSMTLSNHGIIMLVRFISKIKVGVVKWVLSSIHI
jgi:hypothetical protein